MAVLNWSAGFAVATIVQGLAPRRFAARTAWGANEGWQREIAIWNLGLLTIVLRARRLPDIDDALLDGFTVLSSLFAVNHLAAAVRSPRSDAHWLAATGNLAGIAMGIAARPPRRAAATGSRWVRRVQLAHGGTTLAAWDAPRDRWLPFTPALALSDAHDPALTPAADDAIAFLATGTEGREAISRLAADTADHDLNHTFQLTPILPFQPRLLRAFASWEQHWEQAARGLARRYLPATAPVIKGYERLLRRTFPAFRPKPLFYEQPCSYLGNHLTIIPDGATIPWPHYTNDLDFELEFGAILAHPVKDVTPEQGDAAIGGFVVINDLSARDTQWREHRTGIFGPLGKTKTFASAMSAEIVTADEILPHLNQLAASIRVNNEIWSRTTTAGMQHPLGTIVAHAAEAEQLHPGELIASGTLPNGSGLELNRRLAPGDELTLEIERIGTLTNRVQRTAQIL
jgi:2-keto-4-pentenoate hydratase/2-oxohepta-3-ene-1,7-dioic acid hydratase in catechol pathway